jgi:GT2 family glycosyltransferase
MLSQLWQAGLRPWKAARRQSAPQAAHPDLDFTIVITTCNRPLLLPRALASALRQSYDRYDVVVVDDCSDLPVVIEPPTGRTVTLFRTPRRLGFAGAINFGASRAKGRWIAFLDDDDEYEPELLRRTHERLGTAPPQRQFSWCTTVFVHYDGTDYPVRETVRSFPEKFESENELLMTTTSVGSGYGLAVNRKVFHDLGGFDERNFWAIADTEFFFRLIAAGYRPTVVSEPLMRVHRHGGPKMTDTTSYRNRARQCELLRDKYAGLIRQYPVLQERVSKSINELTALAVAAESQQALK